MVDFDQCFVHLLTCVSSVIGPAMGGALAKPCDAYPTFFPRHTIFDKYPFLLPNILCTIVLTIGLTIGVLFLEETNETKKDRFDPGLMAGNWLLQCLRLKERPTSHEWTFSDKSTSLESPETDLLVQEEDPPEYSDEAAPPLYKSTYTTPRQSSSRSQSPDSRLGSVNMAFSHERLGASNAFSKQVILTIATFGVLALYVLPASFCINILMMPTVTPSLSTNSCLSFSVSLWRRIPSNRSHSARMGALVTLLRKWAFSWLSRRSTLWALSFSSFQWPLGVLAH